MLTYATVCWQCPLSQTSLDNQPYADVCSRMLPYADVCSRMLTYAGVCSRMLTYAHVCQLGGENYHILTGSQVLSLLALLVQKYKYLLYWYKSTNTDAARRSYKARTSRSWPRLSKCMLTYADVCCPMLTYADVCSYKARTSRSWPRSSKSEPSVW
jgi:hypothetical protein